MIKRNLTDIYLKEFDSLAEALYLCWHNSFCFETKQLDKDVLKEQILSYGFYKYKKEYKNELPLSFRNKLKFKTLVWINKFTDQIAEDSFYEYPEPHKEVIKEIENNLFKLPDETAKIAYAKITLRDIDKSHIHNQQVDEAIRDTRHKEFFDFLLNLNHEEKENSVNENSCTIYSNYDLIVGLINHFELIDELIELFHFFNIDLISLAEESNFNLYIFNKSNHETAISRIPDNIALPKFNSPFSDDCLIKIMHYLSNKKKLIIPNIDIWLFWFNRKYIQIPEPMKWIGSNTQLSNIFQHICGESNPTTLKAAFCTKIYVKPTRKIYESSKIHKEIEQIITISNKKNN